MTVGLAQPKVILLDALRKQRNLADYSGELVTDAIAAECLASAKELFAHMRAWLEANKPELSSRRFQQRELSPTDQLSEISIEADEVFAQMHRCCSEPGVGQAVARDLLVEAKLTQAWPLGAQRSQVHA